MDNRRESYRVQLEGRETIPAELVLGNGKKLSARVVSISLGGIGVLTQDAPLGLAAHDRMEIRFAFPKSPVVQSFEMQLRRLSVGGVANALGLQFLDSGDAKIEEAREKKIWPFLLERQNREIRSLRQPRKPS